MGDPGSALGIRGCAWGIRGCPVGSGHNGEMPMHVRCPEPEALRPLLVAGARDPLTYGPIGLSELPSAPPGYRREVWSRQLGRGAEVFARSSDALRQWEMHRGSGIVVLADGPVSLDAVVALCVPLPVGSVHAVCRVVDVVDRTDGYGFSYGTLSVHPEQGEERFSVSLAADGAVRAEIVAVSKPRPSAGSAATTCGPSAAAAGRRAVPRRTRPRRAQGVIRRTPAPPLYDPPTTTVSVESIKLQQGELRMSMLSPFRVVDLTDHRGNLAGLILAQLGAEVIDVEPPGGSAARREGPFAGDVVDGRTFAGALVLQSGQEVGAVGSSRFTGGSGTVPVSRGECRHPHRRRGPWRAGRRSASATRTWRRSTPPWSTCP